MAASPAEHACAGTAASVIAMALLYPLDTIRTRLQVETSELGHQTPLQVLQQAARSSEGIQSLYKGIGSTLTTISVSQAVYFFWYNYLKQGHAKVAGKSSMSTGANLAIAYVAGAINATLTCPLWTVSTRLKLVKNTSEAKEKSENENEEGSAGHDVEADDETDTTTATGPDAAEPEASKPRETPVPTTIWAMLLHISRTEGVKSLFRGVPSGLMLCTNPAIQFLVYERLRRRFASAAHHVTSLQAFVFGAVAKAVATVLTYPLQVIQARANANSGSGASTSELAATLLKHEGVAGFFKGIQSKLLQTVLNSAFIFMFYEKFLGIVRQLLGRK